MEILKDKAVMVVDDEPEILELLSDYLEPYVAKIHTAENGLRALEILSDTEVDISILDVNMPGMNGLELLGKIRWNYPDVFNIVISGDPMGEEKKDDIQFQGYKFLKKPFGRKELFEVLIVGINSKIAEGLQGEGRKKAKEVPGVRIRSGSKSGKMSLDRRMKTWLSYYKQLADFRRNNPERWPKYREVWREKNIGYWASQQRNYFRKKRAGEESPITEEQIALLSEISFPWDVKRETWMERYEKVRAFREKNSERWPRCWGDEQNLGIWCSFQRTQYRKFQRGEKNLLTNEKIDLLNKINFPWVFEKEKREESD